MATAYPDLTPTELGDKLYHCADAIRDAIDEARYKNFILPLIFYKSIDDTYYDLIQRHKQDLAGDRDLARKRISGAMVPEEYRWKLRKDEEVDPDDVQTIIGHSENIATFLDECFDALERENEQLRGVVRVTYSDEEALTDQRLRDLIQRIDQFELSTERVDKDFLGEAYMEMIADFARDEGKEGGQFFTPTDVIDLMVRLLAGEKGFEKGASFHDPTCGSAGFLVHAARYYRQEYNGNPNTWTVTGQELNADIAAVAQMNCYMHGVEAEIRREDSLSNPQFPKYLADDEGFDYVLANFPFSADWHKDDLEDDPYRRFDWHEKLPRADRADFAFIMHIAKLLNDRGKAAIVVPHGVLFRKHEERYRKPMVEYDLIESIISLPSNLFQNVSLPSAILLLNREKAPERKNQVQFVHAADERFYEELSNHNDLMEAGRDHIIQNYTEWKTEERVSRTVPNDEIRENDFNLNISLYVDTTEPEEDIDVSRALEEMREIQNARNDAESRLTSHMEALNYE